MTFASIGGPLALVALFIPGTLDGAASSAGLTTLIGSLLFLLPLLIWYRYSERIASDGGLYAFVEAAVGPLVARIHAGFWILSYFLYLVYTVPFIVYYLFPVFWPQAGHYQLLIDALLGVVIAGLMLSPLLGILSAMAAIAVFQMILVTMLAAINISHFGAPAASFIGHGNLIPILSGAGKTSSLYICASLPLFLGGEVRGGTRSVRRALMWAFPVVAVVAILATFPLSGTTLDVVNADIPGVTLARTYGGHSFAVIVGVGVALSVTGLIIAEFLALTRLLGTVFKRPIRRIALITGGAFLFGTLLSLIDPVHAYRLLLTPSLIALWVSQLIVVASYPWFVARYRQLLASDIALATAASVLMAISLYGAATAGAGT